MNAAGGSRNNRPRAAARRSAPDPPDGAAGIAAAGTHPPTRTAASGKAPRLPRIGTAALAVAAALVLCACTGGEQSALHPAGPGAEPIARVWWVMFWGGALILFAVVALALYATLVPPERRRPVPARTFIVGGGLVLPLTVTGALLGYGLGAGHALLPLSTERDTLQVNVNARQWWWAVAYPDGDGTVLHDANVIHIPVGVPVDVHVTASDVIHSFWVPRLGGKVDALPGRVNRIRLQADEPGTFRGQCAEFCGAQHSRMALHVIAHEAADYEAAMARLRDSRLPPPPPDFVRHCASCHATEVAADAPRDGPNLAALRSRPQLGAGTLHNTPENLLRWLRDHQHLKPGNRMPAHEGLGEQALEALADYLAGDADAS